ncbi:MAG: hypothetical protein LBV07_00575 [Syntrophobacterales bacterium]|jgi:hypothetical protein|nr:hypothetical protein [Syntrophobacterales bacterium]
MKTKVFILLLVMVLAIPLIYTKIQTRSRDIQHQRTVLSSYSFPEEPLQANTRLPSFQFKDMTITPLATFLIRARILSRNDYRFGQEAKLSPLDLALGWKRMADPSVYKALNIRQSSRFYFYSWKGEPPVPRQEIVESSANMHLIPADKSVENALSKAKEGKFIRIKGLLVEVRDNDGWTWKSSLTRSDSGAGACELIFVEAALEE